MPSRVVFFLITTSIAEQNGSVATLQHPFSSGFIANESGGGLYVRPLHP
jgi:hypothetical protein